MSAEYKGYLLNKNNIIKAPAIKAGFYRIYHVRERGHSALIVLLYVFII